MKTKLKITYTNKSDQQGEKETKPVTVTPPPITKKVNNQEHADLNKLSESFTYTVDTKVPEVADKFEVSDQLVNELTLMGMQLSKWMAKKQQILLFKPTVKHSL